MTSVGRVFSGKDAIIDLYIMRKRDEINAIRESNKKQKTGEVIEAFFLLVMKHNVNLNVRKSMYQECLQL